METTHIPKATVADYKKLPEGAPFELIRGNLVKEPSPTYGHQDLVIRIASKLLTYTDQFDLGKTLVAPFDVYLDDENVFQPDILFIAKQNLVRIKQDGIHGPPDLVIEILSPSNAYNDFTAKFRVYEKYGVKEYFIIDPDTKEVIGYSLTESKLREAYREEGIVISKILGEQFVF